MEQDELFEGRKVFIKPADFHLEKYPSELVATEIDWIGLKRFTVVDTYRKNVEYHIHNLTECGVANNNVILLKEPGEEEENFARKEKLIITIRRYFNSRAIYNETEANLEKVIDILNL
jgi:hypothetical protein